MIQYFEWKVKINFMIWLATRFLSGQRFLEYTLRDGINANCIACSTATLRNLVRVENMAEALILMKIDYSVVILHSIPAYQFKRLQRLQNTLAGFVLCKYAGLPDLHRLNWLPVKERMDFATVKLTHKILHKSENCPEYINLTWKNTSQCRSLRSNEKDQFKVEHVKHIKHIWITSMQHV